MDDVTDRRFRDAERIVGPIAKRLAQRLRGVVAVDDLLTFGRMGALDAANKWDGRGSFLPFAGQRIKWAMIDGLRSERKLRRTKRAKPADDLDALSAAEHTADAFGPPQEADPAASEDFEASLVTLIDRVAVSYTLGVIAADSQPDVEKDAERIRVRRAVGAMSDLERTVVERHGYAGDTFEEIAESLSMKQTAVFDIYFKVVDRLRKQFDPGTPPHDDLRSTSP